VAAFLEDLTRRMERMEARGDPEPNKKKTGTRMEIIEVF
jgi:hypothetical protein